MILLVYDVTNSFSFDVLEEWIDKIRKLNSNYEETPVLAVVGNKCDMEHQRSVKRDRSHKFAAENGFPSHNVSARTGEAVKWPRNRIKSLYFRQLSFSSVNVLKGRLNCRCLCAWCLWRLRFWGFD